MINNPESHILLVDMDDTIENLGLAWNKWLNDKYNLNKTLADWTQWELTKTFPSLSEEQCFEPLFLPEFWETVTPKEDAQIHLKELSDMGFPIYIVTASHPKTVAAKYTLIEKYFPFIKSNHFITISNKKLLSGWYLIDDGIHNFGGNYKGILFNNPWNALEDLTFYPSIKRCFNWAEITYLIIKEYQAETI